MFKTLFWFTFAVEFVLYLDATRSAYRGRVFDFGPDTATVSTVVWILAVVFGTLGTARDLAEPPVASEQFRAAAKMITAPPVEDRDCDNKEEME